MSYYDWRAHSSQIREDIRVLNVNGIQHEMDPYILAIYTNFLYFFFFWDVNRKI